MNTGIIAGVIAILFGIIKMLIQYHEIDPRSLIRDVVVVYISSMAGMTVYSQLGFESTKPIHAPVFIEKPNF